MLAGIAFLCRAYGVAATPPGQSGYQSVLSQLLVAITGKGIFYGVSIGSILVVLALSANTAFADFPRLARAIAQNGFLPHGLAIRGRRLVYTQGVYALALLAGTLLIVFGGVTDRLIPLYAVGAFMAFTLSQAGMVMHWKRVRGPGSSKSMFVNGLGALATGLTVIIVLIAKFTEGAWITLLLIPGLILMMRLVKRHFDYVAGETDNGAPLNIRDLTPPIVVITIDRWSRITQKALRFAMTISPDVLALHVDYDQESDTLASQWAQLVEEPARRAGLAGPRLVILKSPYRFVIRPILDYALDLEKNNPGRQIAVLTPELVEFRWYLNLLHNHRSAALKALLLFQGDRRIMVINIPWYLTDQDAPPIGVGSCANDPCNLGAHPGGLAPRRTRSPLTPKGRVRTSGDQNGARADRSPFGDFRRVITGQAPLAGASTSGRRGQAEPINGRKGVVETLMADDSRCASRSRRHKIQRSGPQFN
jgi:hypothetical protein